MWVFVIFDLPVQTAANRKAYARFRKGLLEDGFTMLQYSVYIRHCPTKESIEVHMRRVERMMPKLGHVSILQITDRQYGNMKNIWGHNDKPLPGAPAQLSFF
jgi:CRISPR-associated protein Cas2